MYEPNIGSDGYGMGLSELPSASDVIDYLDEYLPRVSAALDDLMCACSRKGLSRAMGSARVIRDSVAVAVERYHELRDSLLSVL